MLVLSEVTNEAKPRREGSARTHFFRLAVKNSVVGMKVHFSVSLCLDWILVPNLPHLGLVCWVYVLVA